MSEDIREAYFASDGYYMASAEKLVGRYDRIKVSLNDAMSYQLELVVDDGEIVIRPIEDNGEEDG